MKPQVKRENASQNMKTQAETSQLTWIDLKGPWLSLIDLYWPYLMKLRINGKNNLSFEAFLRKSNKSIDQKSSLKVANIFT